MMGGQTVLVGRDAQLGSASGTVIISLSWLFIFFPLCDLRWLLVMQTGLCGPAKHRPPPANPLGYP